MPSVAQTRLPHLYIYVQLAKRQAELAATPHFVPVAIKTMNVTFDPIYSIHNIQCARVHSLYVQLI